MKLLMNIMVIHDGRTLAVLRKEIELPFTPFIGLQIDDFGIGEIHYDPVNKNFRAWDERRGNPDANGLREELENIEHYKKNGWEMDEK